MTAAIWIVFTAGPLFVLCLNVLNAFFWPRGRRGNSPTEVSVLIPARNEESSIRGCVSAAVAEQIIVYDDGSTDQTPTILAELKEEIKELSVISGSLPEGWVGKPYACHKLALEADRELLLFVDADVELFPDGISRLTSLLDDLDADALTVVPRQKTGTWLEVLVIPLLHLTYTSWLPLPLIWKTHNPMLLAANGQVLAIRRQAYDAIGGFEAVRNEIVDDMAICRLLKAHQKRVVFADGHHIASCRMYESRQEVWEGFSKNIFEGVGGKASSLVALILLYVTVFVLPYIGLGLSLFLPELFLPSMVGVAANMAFRTLLALRHEHSFVSVLLHPIAVLLLLGIAVNSYIWNLKGAIHWSGRTYKPKDSRS